jgi:hypothetical protein
MPTEYREAYATEADLLLGDMPISSTLSAARFLADSADEIDVRIGRIYVVPVNLALLAPTARITLRLANARLASGRLLMAQASASQDDSLHAYARMLLNEAEAVIESIETNRLPLEGAEYRDDLTDTPGPSIRNQDAVSATAAFEAEFFGNNGMAFLPSSPMWRPGR